MERPLDGVRVLEVAGGVPAALACRWLGGYGADIVRAERVDAQSWLGPLTRDEETYLLAGKRRVPVSDSDELIRLALAADIVIEDGAPGSFPVLEVRARKPSLVVVSVTPFGQNGPYRDHQVTNATMFAMGGIMSLTGDIESTPLVTGGTQAFNLGGINAFSVALAAWFGVVSGGEGDWVDLSIQECNAGMLELYGPGTSYGQPVQLRTGNHVRSLWGIFPCIDGWAGVFCLERQVRSLLTAMDRLDLLDDPRFADPVSRYEPDNDEEMAAYVYGFFAGHTKAELLELARIHRIPLGVATTPADLLASSALDQRGYFDKVDVDGSVATVPGRPVAGLNWSVGPLEAPGSTSLDAALGAWASNPSDAPPRRATTSHDESGRERRLPLAGVKVVDLTMMWAGPFATMRLADMGAEVWKIESPSTWDNIRTLVPQPGVEDPWNSAYYFNAYNRSKKSVTLDLTTERGRELLLALVAQADVVIENYRADVLDNLGIGWEVLRAANPDAVIISMAAFGKTGDDSGFVGFGPVIELMSSLASRTGYGDGSGEPFKTGISIGDPVAGVVAAGAVLAALVRRTRTGTGCIIDLAQREVGAALAGEAFVAASLRGEAPVHHGNRSAVLAPQGCYRCAASAVELGEASDEQWMVVSVRSDEEWDALAGLIGRPDLVGLDLAARFARHDELDAAITAWTRPLDAQAAMLAVQGVGVPGGRVLDTGAILDDPHLLDEQFWAYLPHPRMRRYRQQGVVWRLREAKPSPRRHSPLFGEHNEEILGGLLGLDVAELARLTESGVIGTAPRNPGVG